jgi:hypothetical protein
LRLRRTKKIARPTIRAPTTIPGTNPAAKELAENCEDGFDDDCPAVLLSAGIEVATGPAAVVDVGVCVDEDATLVAVPEGLGLSAILAQYDP